MCLFCSHSATFKLITFGAHHEGVFLIIAPSTRQTNRSTPIKRYQQATASNSEVPLSTLRDELAHNNQNPLDLQDTTLYSEFPPARPTIIDLIDPSTFTSSLCETKGVVKNNPKGCNAIKLMKRVVFRYCVIYFLHCKINSTV